MIPKAAITEWGVSHPWPNPQAIEQDLLLARTIVEIYSHPFLSEELVSRRPHRFLAPPPHIINQLIGLV